MQMVRVETNYVCWSFSVANWLRKSQRNQRHCVGCISFGHSRTIVVLGMFQRCAARHQPPSLLHLQVQASFAPASFAADAEVEASTS